MTTITDSTLAVCALRPGPWPPAPRTCVWCATPLVGRQRRWCANDCERTFTQNHQWGSARMAAVRRDGGACVMCGVEPERLASEARAWLRFVVVVSGGHVVSGGDPVRVSMEQWLAGCRLEVNHRTPIRGRHGVFGCHHHLDGLETLCHACHLDVTAEQFGHRRKQRRTDDEG